MFKKIPIILFVLIMFFPLASKASTLYLESEEGKFGPGNSFAVDVKIKTEESCINTIEANINFPTNLIEVEDFLTGDSILSLWIARPEKSNLEEVNKIGNIYFAGGIPGGYCGDIPGDPGESNIVGKIIFKVKEAAAKADVNGVEIKFVDSPKVLLNDGLGSEDIVKIENTIAGLTKTSSNSQQEWSELIKQDTIQPEPFVVELYENEEIFDGRYHIIFSTTDKQTGLDHYEVLEIRPEEELGVEPKQNFWQRIVEKKRSAPTWKEAKIPYLLEDQTLKSIIKVRAIDKAGNERIVEYIPPKEKVLASKFSFSNVIFVVSLIVGTVFLIILITLFIKYKKNGQGNKE